MKLNEVLAIILFIIIGLLALELLSSQNQMEGFESDTRDTSPLGIFSNSKLHPDVVENDPAHLLKSEIEMTRPFNVLGTLTQQQCYEQDGNRLPEKLGDYSQRTNNYKRTYPDSCEAPYKELVGSFYAPREGAIGAPVPPKGNPPASNSCEFAQ
jgi:hypothetical protein